MISLFHLSDMHVRSQFYPGFTEKEKKHAVSLSKAKDKSFLVIS